MRKLFFVLCCASLVYICGCQKNDCQTFLQGSWKVANPLDSSYIAKDSVIFYKGDSMKELYKFHASDTVYHYYYNSYFVSDQCDEIDFIGVNTWDTLRHVLKYQILHLDDQHFWMRSKADTSTCDSCIIVFRR